ncbi:MAG: aldo/keto reductase [Phycisphaeraceae bacterium]|nr:aldo/keto reductase [Phycisphaeraceae bacterium]
MELRPLGKSGILVSPLGLGTVKIGRNRAVKYPGGDGFALPTDDHVVDLLRTAAHVGINLLDTAPAYGTSEDRLGALLEREDWLGGRDRWVICTKAGEEFDPATAESRYDFSPHTIHASVERSLRRLRTDHLDAVLLHSDGRDGWIMQESGAVEALESLASRGVTRTIGISVKSIEGWRAAIDRLATTGRGIVMTEFAPDEPEHQALALDSFTRGVGVLVKKGLASGHASDPASSIRAITSCPHVSSLIVGTLNPDHIRANAAAMSSV